MAALNGHPIIYVMMSGFLIFMACMAGYGFYTKRRLAKQNADSGMESHFLGAKDFHWIVLLPNTVATFVSGFVLVQVPALGATIGFITCMFMGACNNVGILMNLTWPRYRRVYANRDYAGPNDIISDRYNSVRTGVTSWLPRAARTNPQQETRPSHPRLFR